MKLKDLRFGILIGLMATLLIYTTGIAQIDDLSRERVEAQWHDEGITLDIVFALDVSGSMGAANVTLEKDGFKEVVSNVLLPTVDDMPNKFPVGNTIQVGVVCFGGVVTTTLALTPLTDAASAAVINAAIDACPGSGGGTPTAGAIDASATILTPSTAELQYICLSTDGVPTLPAGDPLGDATTAATNFKNADPGVHVIGTLGVGAGADNTYLANNIAGPLPFGQNISVVDFTMFSNAVATKTGTLLTRTPTMSEWGLIMLGLVMGGALVYMTRRRFTFKRTVTEGSIS